MRKMEVTDVLRKPFFSALPEAGLGDAATFSVLLLAWMGAVMGMGVELAGGEEERLGGAAEAPTEGEGVRIIGIGCVEVCATEVPSLKPFI